MSVVVLRRGGESNPLVAVTELHREEGYQGVKVVVPLELQVEGAGEGNLLLFDCLDVNLLDHTVVGHKTLVVHTVHQGLGHRHLPDAGHVEPVNIVPPVNLVVLVLPVLNTGEVEGGLVGEHETPLGQPLVPGVEDRVQHGLVEEAVTHPLRDDDVHLGHRKLNLLHLAPDDGDNVTQVIVRHNLLSVVDDTAHVHADDLSGTGLCGEHGEDPSPAADIENNLSLEQMLVVQHGIPCENI